MGDFLGMGRSPGKTKKANLKLLYRRLQYGWTQEKAAAEMGISRTAYTMVECGYRDATPEIQKKISEVFGEL